MLKQHLQYTQIYTDNESAMSLTQNSLLLGIVVVVVVVVVVVFAAAVVNINVENLYSPEWKPASKEGKK